MTGDFAKFFKLVQAAAEQCGVEAHLVCGVASDGWSQVRVATNARHTFQEKSPQFVERCIDTMQDSVDQALSQLGEEPEQLRN
jgi:hypothetical protein